MNLDYYKSKLEDLILQAEKDGYELSNNNFRKTDNDKFPVMEVFFVNNTVYEDYGYFNIYDVGVKTINKFNPIPYSTLKNSYFVVYRRGLGNI